MTPADRCARCPGCRTIHACRRKAAGIREAGPSDMRPAPLSPDRTKAYRLIDAVVVLVFVGFTGGLLAVLGGTAP